MNCTCLHCTPWDTPVSLVGREAVLRATEPHKPRTWYHDVLDFHKKFGVPAPDKPGFPSKNIRDLRIDLISEEYEELDTACANGDIVEVADAIADSIYVLVGMAISYGIPLSRIWDEVHASNMRKEGGAMRADGKILKPEGWVPPNIEGILNG